MRAYPTTVLRRPMLAYPADVSCSKMRAYPETVKRGAMWAYKTLEARGAIWTTVESPMVPAKRASRSEPIPSQFRFLWTKSTS